MEIRESFELDEDILNNVTGGSDVHMDNAAGRKGTPFGFIPDAQPAAKPIARLVWHTLKVG